MESQHMPYTNLFAGSTTTMDGLMVDVSNRTARDQIARQLAAAQAYRRQQQQSRVYKPASTGNSPQNLAWRRQAAGPRLYSHPSDVHQAIRRRAATSATGRPQSMFVESRPSSWQPSSAVTSTPEQHVSRHSMYDVFRQHQYQHSNFNTYQTVAMNGLPTPMSQTETSDMPIDNCFGLNSSPSFHQEYTHVPVSSDWSTEMPAQLLTPSSNSQQTPLQYPMDYSQSCFDAYSQTVAYQQPVNQTMGLQPNMQTAPLTPETQEGDDDEADRDDGPELVGMGLYDATPSSGLVGGGSMGSLNGGSPGSKMLKLCDSWTPPDDDKSEDGEADDDEEEEDDDDGEEENDDEEDEDEEEEPEPKEDCTNLQTGAQLPSTGMLNKPFLLDDNEAVGATALVGMTMADWGVMRPGWSQ